MKTNIMVLKNKYRIDHRTPVKSTTPLLFKPSVLSLQYSAISEKGFISTKPNKPNMDVYCTGKINSGFGTKQISYFCVMDGHGLNGQKVA